MFCYTVWCSSKVVLFLLPYTQTAKTAKTVDSRLQCLSWKKICSSKILIVEFILRVLFSTEVGYLSFVITPKLQKPLLKEQCPKQWISILFAHQCQSVWESWKTSDSGWCWHRHHTTFLLFAKYFFWIWQQFLDS